MLETASNEKARKQIKIEQLQKEVAEGKVQPKNKDTLEKDAIWGMSTGVRNMYFTNKFFDKQSKKVNNRQAPTETIDQISKIPNFVKTGSFEGLALKARRL